MIYLDSSYLVRCYLEDPGYREVRELAASDHVACATLGQAEVVAAFHRKLREGALTPAACAATVRQFETDLLNGVVTWLPITAVILQQVRLAFGSLPATVFLRSADALHLVCARESGLLEIHSNDRHLLAAAPQFGLKGVNVIPLPGT